MSLPAPQLDDRRFQDLVDEAKRYVQQRCPEWSDHNVSDPGVTLIELFAQMTDQIVYRLNRVPERNYIKFLDLIGVRRLPPTSARVPVTFWLAAIPTEKRIIPGGTQVATRRTETEEAIEFSSTTDLAIVPVAVQTVRSSVEADRYRNHDDDLVKRVGFGCFSTPPKASDALYIGLSEAAPANVVVLEIACSIDGIGVDPLRPPLVWEAWTPNGWTECELDRDTTGGLNINGEVVVHLPDDHEASIISKVRAGWLRARVIAADDDRPTYSASPIITSMSAHTIGGTVETSHALVVDIEPVGVSDGTPGQVHLVESGPIARNESTHLEVSGTDGWVRWEQVSSFAESGPNDRHFCIDAMSREILFGPAVRLPDGTVRNFGAVPERSASLRLRHLAIGGGEVGNVRSRGISVLTSSIPSVERVENRIGAVGGRDGETIDDVKRRAALFVRSRGRAVTAEDYEELSREAAPEAARVRCISAGDDGVAAGSVRVLVVPDVPDEAGRLRFEQLVPEEKTLAKIAAELDRRRLIGTRISVEPPVYQGMTVAARVRCKADRDRVRVQEQAVRALYTFFHPISGGPGGTGWPFGRPILLGEVQAVLQRVPGIELVEDARLFSADPVSGQRGQPVQRIDIARSALVFSYDHQVVVEAEGQ
jgi:predicted phage baseplate assembly protein